jgi:PilZ domain
MMVEIHGEKGYEETMEKPFSGIDRRKYRRIFIDLPLEYRDRDDSCLRGAIVVNASEGGCLIESPRDVPVGTELSVTVLYPKRFELANFKVTAKIVWKELYWKEDLKRERSSEGYKYGLEFIDILDEDRWKLNLLLSKRFESEEISPSLRRRDY